MCSQIGRLSLVIGHWYPCTVDPRKTHHLYSSQAITPVEVPCFSGRTDSSNRQGYGAKPGRSATFLAQMNIQSDIISTGLLSVTALTAGFFAYLYTAKRQPYLLAWTGGWFLLLLHTFTLSL